MKSKRLVGKQTRKKNSSRLVKTIFVAKKNKNWLWVAGILSGPRRKRINMNIGEINEKSREGNRVVVPGKVLSQGEINKKIKIVALGFSEKAKDKLLKAGCEICNISEEIEKNPNAKGVKILK